MRVIRPLLECEEDVLGVLEPRALALNVLLLVDVFEGSRLRVSDLVWPIERVIGPDKEAVCDLRELTLPVVVELVVLEPRPLDELDELRVPVFVELIEDVPVLLKAYVCVKAPVLELEEEAVGLLEDLALSVPHEDELPDLELRALAE